MLGALPFHTGWYKRYFVTTLRTSTNQNNTPVVKSIYCSNILCMLKLISSMKNKSYLAWPNSFHFSNVSTDTAVIIKDYMLNENFMSHFKVTIRWNLTRSYATRLKSFKYKKHVIKILCVFEEKFYLHMVRLLSGPFKHSAYYIFR